MAAGYILVLLLVGGIAVVKFGKLAAAKGYQASKARRYPIILTIAAISAAVLLYIGSVLIGLLMPYWQSVMQSVYLVGNWFVIAVHLLILNKAFRNMKVAPDAPQR